MKSINKNIKVALSLCTLIYLCGCSSAISPFYNRHPQSSQSFGDRRAPRDNVFAENGGFAKKKPADPFQESSMDGASFQQGLIGDIESPMSVGNNTSIPAAPNAEQNAAPANNNVAPSAPVPVAGQNMPNASLNNKTANAYDYITAPGYFAEQGSSNRDIGYNFYEIADSIVDDADDTPEEQSSTVLASAGVMQQAKLNPGIIKAQTLDDLPPAVNEKAVKQKGGASYAQENHNICKLNAEKAPWHKIALAFNAQQSETTPESERQITPEELDKATQDNYPELKNVPVKPAA